MPAVCSSASQVHHAVCHSAAAFETTHPQQHVPSVSLGYDYTSVQAARGGCTEASFILTQVTCCVNAHAPTSAA